MADNFSNEIPELSISEEDFKLEDLICHFPECIDIEFLSMEDFFDHMCSHFPIPNYLT